MMLNLRVSDESAEPLKNLLNGRYLLVALLLIGMFIIGVGFGPMALKGSMTDQAMIKFGEVELLSNYIFAEGLLPFELVSVLLTAAIVGAVYLAKKN
jgi:NADH:ubiquinone oxidoreductase subunit 6 (subunit J)